MTLTRWPSLSRLTAASFTALLTITACGGGGNSVDAPGAPATTPWRWNLPTGFPEPIVPADNPMSQAKVELGRYLFYDARLSADSTLSCAGCHAPDRAFTDGRALARGITGESHPRNAPSLINVAYNTTLNWANPDVTTLEQQVLTPLFGAHPVEMGVNDNNRSAVLQRFGGDPAYASRFRAAFADEATPVTWVNVGKALAAFQRSLISADSRYDQFIAGKATLTTSEERGRQLFFGDKALCFRCHGSANFNDQFSGAGLPLVEATFHNTGLFNIGGTGAYPEPNRGVYELSRVASDMGKFRAASLRNVELTPPYLHDGSAATLEAVLALYADGGRHVGNGPYEGDGRLNPLKDPIISQIRISAEDQADLVSFLKTLTDPSVLTQAAFASPATR